MSQDPETNIILNKILSQSKLPYITEGKSIISFGSRGARSEVIPSSVAIVFSNVTSSTFANNQPSTAQQMRLLSTSSSDNSSGIGAQQIEITYLTSPDNISETYKKKTEIITMNGTTSVLTLAKNIFRIEYVRVSRVGSSGVAIGAISLQSIDGLTTFEKIKEMSLNSESLTHYIEKGTGSIITNYSFGCTTTAGCLFFIVATKIDSSGNHVGQIEFQTESNSSIVSNSSIPIFSTNPDGKETFFICAVQGRASNQLASGSFSFIDYTL